MATIGLSEAARLTGAARSTLYRAIKTGRLSAAVSPTGAVRIEPAELERVFRVKTGGNGSETLRDTLRETSRNSARPAELVARVAVLEAQMAEKNARLNEAHDQIADLRRRLDAEAEERRRLTALLTDQRPIKLPDGEVDPSDGSTALPSPRSPWRRFLAWRRG